MRRISMAILSLTLSTTALYAAEAGKTPEALTCNSVVKAGDTAKTIKARYKELVKRFHPDANGGDRSREGTLQEILKAYQQLKSTGLV